MVGSIILSHVFSRLTTNVAPRSQFPNQIIRRYPSLAPPKPTFIEPQRDTYINVRHNHRLKRKYVNEWKMCNGRWNSMMPFHDNHQDFILEVLNLTLLQKERFPSIDPFNYPSYEVLPKEEMLNPYPKVLIMSNHQQ